MLLELISYCLHERNSEFYFFPKGSVTTVKMEELLLEPVGSQQSLEFLDFGEIGIKEEKMEDAIKNEIDDIKLEDEEIVIKNEDEEEMDPHM